MSNRGRKMVEACLHPAKKKRTDPPPRGVSKASWILLRDDEMRSKLREYAEDLERTRDEISGFIAGLYASEPEPD